MKKIRHELELIVLKFQIVTELFGFLAQNKLWWAIPLILLSILLVLMFAFGQSTGVPFIYPFF